jgi:polar amino acid transport system permease protein
MPTQSVWTLLSWGPEGWLDDLAHGIFITVSLAVATLPIGLAIGFFVAVAKQSSEPSLRVAGNIYTTIFRGLPELLTLFLIYFGAQIGLQSIVQTFDAEATIDVNSFVSGMVALGVVFSSYASEVFLSAFRAIPRGQYEGGYAIGLTKGQTMRLVVLPQLIRIALPGLAYLWLILLKDTALVSAIGLSDILRQASIASRVTKHAFLFFGVAGLIYLVLAIISSFGIHAIERAVGSQEAHR